MSTSTVAEGKVRNAYERGKLLDDAYLIDCLGNASKDHKFSMKVLSNSADRLSHLAAIKVLVLVLW